MLELTFCLALIEDPIAQVCDSESTGLTATINQSCAQTTTGDCYSENARYIIVDGYVFTWIANYCETDLECEQRNPWFFQKDT